MRISNFLIAIVIVSVLTGVFGLFMSSVADEYDVVFNESDLAVYNKLADITNITEDVRDQVEESAEESGALDILGGLVMDAYRALKLVFKSFELVDEMSDSAVTHADLGESGKLFKQGLSAIVLILIVIGGVIAAIMKWRT